MSKNKKNNKTQIVNIRLTDKEFKKLNKLTEKFNISKSDYIRKVLFDKNIAVNNTNNLDYYINTICQEIINVLKDYKNNDHIDIDYLNSLEEKLWER